MIARATLAFFRGRLLDEESEMGQCWMRLLITWCRNVASWRPAGPAQLYILCFGWRWIFLITPRLPNLLPLGSLFLLLASIAVLNVLCFCVGLSQGLNKCCIHTLCFKKHPVITTEKSCTFELCHSRGWVCVSVSIESASCLDFCSQSFVQDLTQRFYLKSCSCHIDLVQQFQMSGLFFRFFFSIPSCWSSIASF